MSSGEIYWVRLHLGDLALDTMSLSPQALGAYIRLYLHAVRHQSPIADDPRACMATTGCASAQWRRIRVDLVNAGLLETIDGELRDRRAEDAIANFRAMSVRNRENIRKRWQTVGGDIEDTE